MTAAAQRVGAMTKREKEASSAKGAGDLASSGTAKGTRREDGPRVDSAQIGSSWHAVNSKIGKSESRRGAKVGDGVRARAREEGDVASVA